jgi:hypothetical protein
MLQTMMKRVYNARMTALRAKNPVFKAYWNEVADKLEEKMGAYG